LVSSCLISLADVVSPANVSFVTPNTHLQFIWDLICKVHHVYGASRVLLVMLLQC
jgi:hypothetical protein